MQFDNVVQVVAEARKVELPLGKSVVAFSVTHFDPRTATYARIKRKLTKPVQKLIEVDMLSDDQDRAIAVRAFVKAAVVGWSGVKSSGSEVPYTEDACCELLQQVPALFYALIEEAQDNDNFKPTEAEAGN